MRKASSTPQVSGRRQTAKRAVTVEFSTRMPHDAGEWLLVEDYLRAHMAKPKKTSWGKVTGH